MPKKITMDTLTPGAEGIVKELKTEGSMRKRLHDLGIIENTEIRCVAESPLGDPKAYLIRGSIIALRKEDAQNIIIETENIDNEKTVLLAGNPNVGKSTVFNALTGMHQHTGNWTGKTVSSALGTFSTDLYKYNIIDLPGTYSLDARSAEEEVTKNNIISNDADAIIIVCDATNLEHSLYLALETIEITKRVIVCINLLDEAEQQGIKINLQLLEETLGVKTVGIIARKKKTLSALTEALDELVVIPKSSNTDFSTEITNDEYYKSKRILRAEEIAKQCTNDFGKKREFGRADKILTSKVFGYPIMLLMLLALFWITIVGANYPSKLLSKLLITIGEYIRNIFIMLDFNNTAISLLIDGIYEMTARVVSVMLPPMAIFFPLFTILEDLGYLPRVAFNLDKPFNKCKACGKQALTMCMGFGCNACGVTGARIIDSSRDRLLAILTNSFVPCNGKFPTIIAIISMFLIGSSVGFVSSVLSALVLTVVIVIGVVLTFFATKLISSTLLKGESSSFALEIPPFRKPQFTKIAIRSILDRTIFVLGRAIVAAAPAGLLVWIFANVNICNESILSHCIDFLNPVGTFFGLDGVILTAFILGSAANETVIPIMIMSYLCLGSPTDFSSLAQLRELLIANNWTIITAVCTTIFTLLHWPCATTLITVKKETNSIKWTIVSALLPTVFGLLICFCIATISKIL